MKIAKFVKWNKAHILHDATCQLIHELVNLVRLDVEIF